MRGKPPEYDEKKDAERITPACAGKTAGLAFRVREVKDHPRVCGENGAVRESDGAAMGSPPRVRGKPSESCAFLMSERITPACAGKTGSSR